MSRIAVVLAFVASGCAFDPLVGGACIDGFIICDGVCVDPMADETACGGCGNVCAEDQQCYAGACQGQDCEADEAWCDGAGCADLASDPANCGACGLACPDGARCASGQCVADCPPALTDCSGACVDSASDDRNCGACGVTCGADQSCAGGACADDCGDGLSACAGQCVDASTDPDNCGGCGIVCDTGLCDGGHCRATAVGHLVVIGHDYVRSRRDQGRLVGNAILIAQGDVTVVAYEGDTDPAGVANVEAAVLRAAGDAGRTVAFAPLDDPGQLGQGLADADVFVVHAQTAALAESLAALGVSWRETLGAFLSRGGVVVVLDGPATGADRGGTWRIVAAAELLAIEASTDVTRETLDLVDPGDAVALGMSAHYRAERHSVSFTAPDGSAVVASAAGPVVLHQVYLP